jgi:hypothetical protein
MNDQIDALGTQYRKCAEAFGAASVRGDAKAMNKNFDKLAAIGPKLRAYGAKGEAILRCLMKDRSEAVASWAATDSLPFAEAEGLEVLDAIATRNGPIPFGARMTAKQWRAGELKLR